MLNKTSIQAIKAFLELARLPEGECAGVGDVARTINAPKNYLGKLLQSLTGEGLVTSQKGLGGGFRLSRPPEKIRLMDIVEPIERVSRWSGCLLREGKCSSSRPCSVHDHWKAVRDAYFHFLEQTSLADLTDDK